jgi:serine/threonine-protein kinase HipA
MRIAKVFSHKIYAGVLTEHDDGFYTFRYEDQYFANAECTAISLTLPKTEQEYHAQTLFPFFSNILSEGTNRKIQSRMFKLDEEDDFGLLLATANAETIGAITVEKIDV